MLWLVVCSQQMASYHCQPVLLTQFSNVDLPYANEVLLMPQLCFAVLLDAQLIRATGLSVAPFVSIALQGSCWSTLTRP